MPRGKIRNRRRDIRNSNITRSNRHARAQCLQGRGGTQTGAEYGTIREFAGHSRRSGGDQQQAPLHPSGRAQTEGRGRTHGRSFPLILLIAIVIIIIIILRNQAAPRRPLLLPPSLPRCCCCSILSFLSSAITERAAGSSVGPTVGHKSQTEGRHCTPRHCRRDPSYRLTKFANGDAFSY